MILSFVVLVGMLPQCTGAQQLGDPPRDPSADSVPRNPGSIQLLSSVAPIDTSNRNAVVRSITTSTLRQRPGCLVDWKRSFVHGGATSAAYREATSPVNYYRAMAGLPGTVVLDGALDSAYQESALMMSANGALNHYPPSTWFCYTSAGAAAAANSNITLFDAGPEANVLYVDDAGMGNDAVGPRRWVLSPLQTTATGSVISFGITASNVKVVGTGAWGSRPATPEFVSWPPPGFVPYQILPSGSERWSMSISGADFSAATVSVTKAGVAVPISLLPIDPNYGDHTLVWRVSGISYGAPPNDESYDVSVSNVRIGTVTRMFMYTVTVIDPVLAVPPAPGAPTNLRITP